MRDRIEGIRARGAELVIVGNGTPQHAAWFVEDLDLDAPLYTDPDLAGYRAVGARGGVLSVLHPGTFRSAWRAWRRGFRQTAVMGDPMQQGAVVVVLPGGAVAYRHVSRYAGDHPDLDRVLDALRVTSPPPPHPRSSGASSGR